MYAIIETGGKQYWVSPKDTIQVELLDKPVGEKLSFKALWTGEESEVGVEKVPAPPASAPETADKTLPAATVTAQVVRHFLGRKLIVFKKKPKTGYTRRQGHRQNLTELKIESIELN
ncbi:MAG: 50S ribosomal protein L21 [Elusimicrobia bacterium]|nr:50S ribosomal protein L21 [Elusimicrobiota bacterium]